MALVLAVASATPRSFPKCQIGGRQGVAPTRDRLHWWLGGLGVLNEPVPADEICLIGLDKFWPRLRCSEVRRDCDPEGNVTHIDH